MSQPTDAVLGNESGNAFRTELNAIIQAILSSHEGNTAPPYAVEGMFWINNTSTSPAIWNYYTGSVWLPFAKIDYTAGTIRFTSMGDGTEITGLPSIKQIQNNPAINGTATGTAPGAGATNVYALDLGTTPNFRPTALVDGMELVVKWPYTNNNAGTNFATLNVTLASGTSGAKNIIFPNGDPVLANFLISGAHTRLRFNGTSWEIQTATFIAKALGNLNMAANAIVQDAFQQAADQTAASGTITMDYSKGSWFKVTPTGNITLAVSNLPTNLGADFIIQAVNFGAYTVTFPTITWLGGTPVFQSSGTDYISVVQDGNGHLYGYLISSQPVATSPGFIWGYKLANNGGSPGTTVDVNPGQCADSSGAQTIKLTTLTSCNITTTGANALDTGSYASNTWYHIFVISGPSGVATLASQSATTPTLPSGYTYYRRVGSIRTDGSAQVIPFVHIVEHGAFYWGTPVVDMNATAYAGTSSRTLLVISAPVGVKTEALIRLGGYNNGVPMVVTSPDEIDYAASANSLYDYQPYGSNYGYNTTIRVFTDIYSQIGIRTSAASQYYRVVTRGWIDQRGRLG